MNLLRLQAQPKLKAIVLAIMLAFGAIPGPFQATKADASIWDGDAAVLSVLKAILGNETYESGRQTIDEINKWLEMLTQTGIIAETLAFTEMIQEISDEMKTALGTVEDIMDLPQHLIGEMESLVGGVIDTFMSPVEAVKGTYDQVMDIYGQVSEFEALGRNIMSGSLTSLDFGDFGNAYNAFSAMRGVHGRTSVELMNMIEEDAKFVEDISRDIDRADTHAGIARGQAQMGAAVWREQARANQLQALNMQYQGLSDLSREEAARARSARYVTDSIQQLAHLMGN